MILAADNDKNLSSWMTLFLCGDVMTGRGIDQVLPHPGDPRIHEPYLDNANKYVEIAKEVNGPIPEPVDFSYIWGDALVEFKHALPDIRIINLETSVTTSDDYWPDKGIHYRMNPGNIPCITAAGIDCCVLSNNHVLDWGYKGLAETLKVLRDAGIKTVGAGQNMGEAKAAAVMEISGKGRVIVFAFGIDSSGIPRKWTAGADKPGINLLPDFSHKTVSQIGKDIKAVKRTGDVVVVSVHWGANWGYEIPPEHIQFAHELIDTAGVDIIHGHSSHHAKGIEIFKEKPVIYGCGDFLNDYEGIGGYEEYRSDLALMYFVRMEIATGKLIRLEMVPAQIRHFRSNRVSDDDLQWLNNRLNRECSRFNSRVEITKEKTLALHW